MCFFEGCRVTLVAGHTQGSIIGFQEICLVRAMGEVAGVAWLFSYYLVDYLFFIVFLLMAPVTKFTAFCPQKTARLGCMGIVTTDASFLFQGGVHHRFVESYLLFFVAGVAHLIPLLFKYLPWNDSVPEVAFLAFFLFDSRVYTCHFEVFIGECLVTIQAILAHEPASFRRGCAGSKVNNRA
jgi:hypothetical protein